MSISGTDASLHGGGQPDRPNENFQENTLGYLNNRANANIVPQDKIIDAAILTGKPFGREQAMASRPTLEFPIWTLRGATSQPTDQSELRESQYNQLFNALPKDLQQRLAAELPLPLSERDPELMALQNTLVFFSLILVQGQQAANLFAAHPAAEVRAGENLALVSSFLETLLPLARELVVNALADIDQLDLSPTERDKLVNDINNFSIALGSLETLAKEERLTSEDIALLGGTIALLQGQYLHSSEWGQLQILGTLFSMAALITEASALPDGLQPLLIAISIAMIGIAGKEESAIFGDPFNEALATLFSAFTPLTDQSHLLTAIATTLILSFLSLYASLPDEATATLMLQFFLEQPWLSSLITDNFLSLPLGMRDGTPPGELLQSQLELLILFVIIKSTETANIEALESEIIQRLQTAENLFLELTDNGLDSGLFNPFIVALSTARIALQEGDIDAFIDAVDAAFAALGIPQEQLEEQFNQIARLPSILNLYLNEQSLDDQTNTITGMTQV